MGRGVRLAAAGRRPVDEPTEAASADPTSDPRGSGGVALTGLALPDPRSAAFGVEGPDCVAGAEPVVQVLRRRASAKNLPAGEPAPVPQLAVANPVAALRRQAATVAGQQPPAGRPAEALTIRRTLQDAIAWGADRGLTFESDDDVLEQVDTWSDSGDPDLLNQRDQLLYAYRRGQPDLPGPHEEVVEELAAGYPDDDKDEEYVPGEKIPAPKKKRSKRKKPARSELEMTHKKKGGVMGKRPKGKPVKVAYQSIKHVSLGDLERPVQVSGEIVPTSTSERGSAPEPHSGLKVATSKKSKLDDRNSGIVDAHKGHIFALELGGPDVGENIVAQFGHFQSVGVWRAAERAALDFALARKNAGQFVEYEVQLRYKPYQKPEQGSRKGLLFPSAFIVTVRPINPVTLARGPAKVLFDGENLQDEGQFREGNRKLDKADAELEPDLPKGADGDGSDGGKD